MPSRRVHGNRIGPYPSLSYFLFVRVGISFMLFVNIESIILVYCILVGRSQPQNPNPHYNLSKRMNKFSLHELYHNIWFLCSTVAANHFQLYGTQHPVPTAYTRTNERSQIYSVKNVTGYIYLFKCACMLCAMYIYYTQA